MHRPIRIQLFAMSLGLAATADAQTFQNGDLTGSVSNYSELPPQWAAVPHTDPACGAVNSAGATPDLVSPSAPGAAQGVPGIAYSGPSFVSGVHAIPTNVLHEGIQQSVSGFTPGLDYTIGFHQCVNARYLCEDTSGSWAVYVDAQLIGISTPSSSLVPMMATGLEWEPRTLTFTATSTTHLIKFLAQDDDPVLDATAGDLGGGLSMGIDLITLSQGTTGITTTGLAGLALRQDLEAGVLYVDDHQFSGAPYTIVDMTGRPVQEGLCTDGRIAIGTLPRGTYVLRFGRPAAAGRFLVW